MIQEHTHQLEERMEKSIDALRKAFNRIRTGRAHPSLLDGISVDYYGVDTPISQIASIVVEDARTLALTVWENSLVSDVEKSILRSDLGLNPNSAGAVIRIPLPALTEESRKTFGRQAKQEAEKTRVSVRSVRRDVLSNLKSLEKSKSISKDDERRIQDEVQKITDRFIARVDSLLTEKEKDLMDI
ncbi:MAG: ribosome recycling factor [Cellvibrionales bacterium TMED148]|nr:ribosome recycling factor [Porticoccaceae bacterium]RPG89635.1 MAG: ribosome recycling factor [Cellvibrionales bacterium TMED148]